MIIWSGRGFIPVLILIVTLFISTWIIPDEYSDYVFVTAFLISSVFSWYFGYKWNMQNERILTDEKTGQRLVIKNNHSLFWIPMQYWGIIFSIFGIIILFQNSVVLAIVLSVILMILLVFQFSDIRSLGKIKSSKFKSKKVRLMEQQAEEEEEKKRKEAERLRRRKEKENPSRFMPK